MVEIQIIQLNMGLPGHPLLGALAADRIRQFATEHDETVDPERLTRLVMAALWAGDPGTLVTVLVNPETGSVVGHLLGELQSGSGGQTNLVLAQAKADGNVGEAMKDAIRQGEEWGAERGAKMSMFVTHRNPETLKRWNPEYKVARTVFVKPLNGA